MKDAAKYLWRFYRGIEAFREDHYEFELFKRLLDGPLDQEAFKFYLKVSVTQCKRLLIQSELGDQPNLASINLEVLIIPVRDWVPVSSQVFSSAYKPTASVQRICERLTDTDFTDEVPASVLLKCCMDEFEEMLGKKQVSKVMGNRGHKPKCESLDQLFYRNPDFLLHATYNESALLPSTKKPLPHSDFNLLAYGKHPFQEHRIQPAPSRQQSQPLMLFDEELAQASVDESRETRKSREQCPVQFNGFHNSVTDAERMQQAEMEKLKTDLETIQSEQQQGRAALEDLMRFCQKVSYQHDLLLSQNSKIKRLLSLVTDRLIRLDPKLIKDIDFGEVINDPCKDFLPMGGGMEAGKSRENEELQVQISARDMPFSETAGKNGKRNGSMSADQVSEGS